ncbi:Ubiquitin carboxyl-terminal hydrolase [Pyrenophora tritici-repentis]|nr:Ubiquitin carboxyl-terminal hydrolase [Pyrenophora tritici-repentis]
MPASQDTKTEEVKHKTNAQVEAERAVSISATKKELLALVDPKMAADEGSNQTGLESLSRGARLSHERSKEGAEAGPIPLTIETGESEEDLQRKMSWDKGGGSLCRNDILDVKLVEAAGDSGGEVILL